MQFKEIKFKNSNDLQYDCLLIQTEEDLINFITALETEVNLDEIMKKDYTCLTRADFIKNLPSPNNFINICMFKALYKKRNVTDFYKYFKQVITTEARDLRSVFYKRLMLNDIILVFRDYRFMIVTASRLDMAVVHPMQCPHSDFFDIRKHNSFSFVESFAITETLDCIPFCLAKDGKIYWKYSNFSFRSHDDIILENDLDEDAVIKLHYYFEMSNKHSQYSDFGILGIESSDVYNHVELPYSLKLTHLKRIEDFIVKAEANNL